MRRIAAGIVAATFSLTSVAANAAVITAQGGQVYVNTGNGFSRVEGPVQAAPGARVLLRESGQAIVSYQGGCIVRLGGNRTWNVAAKAPCAPGQQVVDLTQPASTAGRQSGPWQDTPRSALGAPTTAAAAAGIPTTALVVGGLVVAAGAGIAIVVVKNNKKSSPASP